MDVVVGMAHVLAWEETLEQAVELLAFAVHHPATREVERNRARQLLAQLQPQLTPDALTSATARGEARELEEVVAELLDEGDGQ
jgi:hypothetical protein